MRPQENIHHDPKEQRAADCSHAADKPALRTRLACQKRLVIEGRRIWEGDAVAIPNRNEPGVNGLLPLSMFKAVYVSNSEGYVVFE